MSWCTVDSWQLCHLDKFQIESTWGCQSGDCLCLASEMEVAPPETISGDWDTITISETGAVPTKFWMTRPLWTDSCHTFVWAGFCLFKVLNQHCWLFSLQINSWQPQRDCDLWTCSVWPFPRRGSPSNQPGVHRPLSANVWKPNLLPPAPHNPVCLVLRTICWGNEIRKVGQQSEIRFNLPKK